MYAQNANNSSSCLKPQMQLNRSLLNGAATSKFCKNVTLLHARERTQTHSLCRHRHSYIDKVLRKSLTFATGTMLCLHFGNRVTNFIGFVQNLEKIGKAWIGPYLTCLARRCSILFSTVMFIHVVPAIVEWKTLQSILKQYVFGLLITVMIVL